MAPGPCGLDVLIVAADLDLALDDQQGTLFMLGGIVEGAARLEPRIGVENR